jgi:hypothetical protein
MLALSDASDDDLLRSMNEQAKRLSLWPWVAATLLAVLWYIFIHIPNMPDVMSVLLVASSIAATCLVYFRDKWKRLTVLFYEPDEAIMARFQRLLAGAAKAAAIRKVQAINARAMYANSKYHFGAKTGVKFSRGSLRIGQGPGVVANTEVPIVESGSIILAFYPDRVLVFSRRSVGAIEYQDIEAKSLVSKFVETERVPGDATVIGHQWRYANKQGGPDRRFKANRQFPLCQYNELVLASPRGLDIHLHGSKSDGFDDFVDALKALASSPAAASPKATHRGSVN